MIRHQWPPVITVFNPIKRKNPDLDQSTSQPLSDIQTMTIYQPHSSQSAMSEHHSPLDFIIHQQFPLGYNKSNLT